MKTFTPVTVLTQSVTTISAQEVLENLCPCNTIMEVALLL